MDQDGTYPNKILEILTQGSKLDVNSVNLSDIAEALDTDLELLLELRRENFFEDSLDYLLEGALERLTNYFKTNEGVEAINDRLKEIIRKRLLFMDAVVFYQNGLCPQEIIARASECLGELSRVTSESIDAQLVRIKSGDWRERLWGARAIRSLGPVNAEDLLANLKDDPYIDEDGYYLVREAAGFPEDHQSPCK